MPNTRGQNAKELNQDSFRVLENKSAFRGPSFGCERRLDEDCLRIGALRFVCKFTPVAWLIPPWGVSPRPSYVGFTSRCLTLWQHIGVPPLSSDLLVIFLVITLRATLSNTLALRQAQGERNLDSRFN